MSRWSSADPLKVYQALRSWQAGFVVCLRDEAVINSKFAALVMGWQVAGRVIFALKS